MFGKFDNFLSFAEKKKISNKPQQFGKKCRVELALNSPRNITLPKPLTQVPNLSQFLKNFRIYEMQLQITCQNPIFSLD